MSVNEKLKDAEAGGYGSIAPEPENDAVAYVKRHTIALGALSGLAFGAAAVALVTGPPPLALASGGYLVGGMLMDSDNSIPECASQDSGCLYNALDAPGFPASSFGIVAAGNFGPQGCDLAPGETPTSGAPLGPEVWDGFPDATLKCLIIGGNQVSCPAGTTLTSDLGPKVQAVLESGGYNCLFIDPEGYWNCDDDGHDDALADAALDPNSPTGACRTRRLDQALAGGQAAGVKLVVGTWGLEGPWDGTFVEDNADAWEYVTLMTYGATIEQISETVTAAKNDIGIDASKFLVGVATTVVPGFEYTEADLLQVSTTASAEDLITDILDAYGLGGVMAWTVNGWVTPLSDPSTGLSYGGTDPSSSADAQAALAAIKNAGAQSAGSTTTSLFAAAAALPSPPPASAFSCKDSPCPQPKGAGWAPAKVGPVGPVASVPILSHGQYNHEYICANGGFDPRYGCTDTGGACAWFEKAMPAGYSGKALGHGVGQDQASCGTCYALDDGAARWLVKVVDQNAGWPTSGILDFESWLPNKAGLYEGNGSPYAKIAGATTLGASPGTSANVWVYDGVDCETGAPSGAGAATSLFKEPPQKAPLGYGFGLVDLEAQAKPEQEKTAAHKNLDAAKLQDSEVNQADASSLTTNLAATSADATGCRAGAKTGNTGTGSMDVYGTKDNYWCTVSPAKEKLRKIKTGVGRGSWCGWKATYAAGKYTCGTCLEVTCGGNAGHAISVDSNEYDANQFMDVHTNDGSGFWDKVCPGVTLPGEICGDCSWKVVAESNCYDA